MPAINEDTREFWQQLADDLSAQRPYPGRRIEIVKGRKHKGKTGIVRRHMPDRYYDAFRYASEASAHMIQMAGREGYVVLVDPENGPSFWVRADYTKVLVDISGFEEVTGKSTKSNNRPYLDDTCPVQS